MVRPDVITALTPDGAGGGQHHQASARPRARGLQARAAIRRGIPNRSTEGLRPWQPKKFYFSAARFGGRGDRRPAARPSRRRPGRLRSAARQDVRRDRHRSAQHAQVPGHGAAAGAARARRPAVFSWSSRRLPGRCSATSGRSSTASTRRIAGLAQFAGARPPRELTRASPRSRRRSQTRAATSSTPKAIGAIVPPLLDRPARGARAARAAARRMADRRRRDGSRSSSGCGRRSASSSRRSSLANGVRVEALADDGVVVPGQPVRVSVMVANRGAADVTVKQVTFDGFAGDGAVRADGGGRVGGRGGGGGRGAPRRRRRFRRSGAIRSARCDADVDSSRETRASASRTGIAMARPGATRSTTTRRSGCRTVRRRSTCR